MKEGVGEWVGTVQKMGVRWRRSRWAPTEEGTMCLGESVGWHAATRRQCTAREKMEQRKSVDVDRKMREGTQRCLRGYTMDGRLGWKSGKVGMEKWEVYEWRMRKLFLFQNKYEYGWLKSCVRSKI